MKPSKDSRRRRFRKRVIASASIAAGWLVALSLTVDCSHGTPYLRDAADARGAESRILVASTTEPRTKSSLKHRLLLIGDAGDTAESPALLRALTERAQTAADKTTIVFLGDNIYPDGLVAAGARARQASERKLLAQVTAAKQSGAEFLFVPGNHDWAQGKPEGFSHVLESERFIAKQSGGAGQQLPGGGTPGPACLDRPGVRLVLIDTQWFIHHQEKPRAGSDQAVFADIAACIQESPLPVVVLGHHPLKTNGPHGNFFSFRQHVFPLTELVDWLYVPLPIVGSLYPVLRSQGVSLQDVGHEENQRLVRRLRAAMSSGPTLLYAAGHEHTLQVFEDGDGPRYSLVSGSGSTTAPVGDDESTLYAHSARGFMELIFREDGTTLLRALAQKEGELATTFERVLDLK